MEEVLGRTYQIISPLNDVDVENIEPELEHVWEIPGANRHSKMLLGVMYRSERIQDFQH